MGFYPEDPVHAEKGVEITVRVGRKLIYGYAMKLEKVANHHCWRIPKSGLQLGSKNGNLVVLIHKVKMTEVR